jgi:polar amino acid transport system permease protein
MLSHLAAQLPRFLTWYNAAFLLQAAALTLALSAVGSVVGIVLGAAIAVVRRTSGLALAPLRWLGVLHVELFRRIPFLVTLLLVFYATQLGGFEMPLFAIAAIAVSLISTAYLAEIVRAGLASVHPNQWHSAAVANFSLWQTLRLVIVPQAWPVVLPPAFGFFVMFLKDTALASQIGVVELTYAGKALNNRGFAPLLTFGAVLLLYFALSYPLTLLGRRLEARLARPRHH